MTESTEGLCMNFEDLASGDGDPLISQWPRLSLISNLGCSVPFFDLSLSPVYKSICDPTAGSVGEQNLPPQISLWHGDSFERKTIKKQKTQEAFLFKYPQPPPPAA